jgi:hypothetical protein
MGTRRELFVDHTLIDRLSGLSLRLNRPSRGEVVISYDAPWEDATASALSVFEDGDTVRLYYRGGIPDREGEKVQTLCLAESTDGGLSYKRPNLGLVEFAGSKRNNILMIGGPPHVPPAFIDTNPDCDPQQRYKGLTAAWKELYAMCSPDGLRWRPMQRQPLRMEGTFDTVNTAFWDARSGCYRSYTRYFEGLAEDDQEADLLGPRPTARRAIQSSTSTDFVHWAPVVPHRYDDGLQMQLYTNATLPCPGAEHIYLSFPNRYVQERKKHADHPYPGVNDALFMVSRDAVHWVRYPEAWVRPGLDPRNWTERNNYPTWGMVRSSPKEWSMYISEHYRQQDAPARLRRLAIRPHGFASLHADYAPGECLTRPLRCAAGELRLNYSTSAAGSLRVEVQSPDGRAIEGFALQDMEPLYGDALDEPVTWRGGRKLSSLAGEPLRLRFVLQDADLYALRSVAP